MDRLVFAGQPSPTRPFWMRTKKWPISSWTFFNSFPNLPILPPLTTKEYWETYNCWRRRWLWWQRKFATGNVLKCWNIIIHVFFNSINDFAWRQSLYDQAITQCFYFLKLRIVACFHLCPPSLRQLFQQKNNLLFLWNKG